MPVIAGIILLVAVVGGLAALALRGGSTNGDSPTPIPTASTASSPSLAPRIDGIPCVQEMLNYHVHSHLSINAAGKPVTVPANVGIKIGNSFSCLYWLHTHDSSGLIHVEAPHVIHPTLGQFFDVWGQKLSRTQVAGARVGPGQSMKIWVNRKPYTGNPRAIVLTDHKLITIDIGPPFPREEGFDFSGL